MKFHFLSYQKFNQQLKKLINFNNYDNILYNNIIYNFFSRFILFTLTIFIVLSISNSAYSLNLNPRTTEDTYPNFERWFAKRNIGKVYSPASYHELTLSIRDLIAKEEEIQNDPKVSSSDKKWSKSKLKFLNHGLNLLSRSKDTSIDDEDLITYFYQGKRIIYSLFANEYEERRQARSKIKPFRKDAIERGLQVAGRFFKRKSLYKVELLDPNTPIGIAQAKKEAKFLRYKNQKSFLTVEELAKLTPWEISELDIRNDHPTFFSQSFLDNIDNNKSNSNRDDSDKDNDLWKRNEQWLNRGLTKLLDDKYKIKEQFPSFTYNL
ncbi:MAG: hypothetical protein HQK51_21590, partial [Oligoflexia bacterium]|nr:hypothetical protein [Oligoflexia bacterium]